VGWLLELDRLLRTTTFEDTEDSQTDEKERENCAADDDAQYPRFKAAA
jgi:hypothetical protein